MSAGILLLDDPSYSNSGTLLKAKAYFDEALEMNIETVNKVINIGFNVDGMPEGSLKISVNDYLKTQGALMREMGYDGKTHNPFTLIGFSNFIKNNIHHCYFFAYFTTFSTSTVMIDQICDEPQKLFNFDFTITNLSAHFMLANWEKNPDFRVRVADFIKKYRSGTDYFDDPEVGTGGKGEVKQ
jgi:hypothetical protein